MTSPLLSSFEVGDGTPVLAIHGWELNGQFEAFDLEPILSTIPGFRRIYVDLPGHGSTPAGQIQNLDDILSRLVEFIDARLGSEKFLLVGSSCGGALARAVALRYSGQVEGLLLRVPAVVMDSEMRDIDAFEPLVRNEALLASMLEEEKALLGDIIIQTPAYLEALRASYPTLLAAIDQSDKERLALIRNDKQRYRLSDDLDRKFHAPTLIVTGRQDTSVGYRDALAILHLYPRATHVVLDRSTHGLPVDSAERGLFAALVKDWLFRVKEWQESGRGGQ
ncbi:hypothetical protein H2200_013345 [Cladophialophora chaetospira]|uniref:AB hydrolase-1 domain-containing protein n=1 Tax=Cladophialophora chaetospira TaxID=386627 RepID=A0AA39CBD3_9EURO|nr:hypothetical protein H2200_013345 [Cladophialophora chaetospira]